MCVVCGVWCVVCGVCVCVIMSDLETSRTGRPGPDLGSCATEKYTAYLSSPARLFTLAKHGLKSRNFFCTIFYTVDDLRSPEFK